MKVQPGTSGPRETAQEFADRISKQMREEAVRLEAKADQLKAAASVMDGKSK